MACILVTAAFGFEISNIGHVLPLQANYEKSKKKFHEFFYASMISRWFLTTF
jgi:hypothetical protein